MEQFKGVDWIEVLERLTHESLRLFNAGRFAADERVLESFGDGFEDFAQTAIIDLLDEENSTVKWDAARGAPSTEGVLAYLKTVVKNDFLDRVRRKRLKGQRSLVTSANGSDTVEYLVEPSDPAPLPDSALATRQPSTMRQRLADDFKARPDDELELYVMLQFDGESWAPYAPREAAQELGMDVKRVYLLKERLERRINRLFKDELAAVASRRHERPV